MTIKRIARGLLLGLGIGAGLIFANFAPFPVVIIGGAVLIGIEAIRAISLSRKG